MKSDSESQALLKRAADGDSQAAKELFGRHRNRLKRMVLLRLDHRIVARVDPSDVVQETLVEAYRRLRDFTENQQIEFYPWLRSIACDRLNYECRRHIATQARSVHREEVKDPELSDQSVNELADRLCSTGTSPSQQIMRDESRRRVRRSLEQLRHRDREVLVLRYLEEMSTREGSQVLGISENAFTKRHLKALTRLRRFLDEE